MTSNNNQMMNHQLKINSFKNQEQSNNILLLKSNQFNCSTLFVEVYTRAHSLILILQFTYFLPIKKNGIQTIEFFRSCLTFILIGTLFKVKWNNRLLEQKLLFLNFNRSFWFNYYYWIKILNIKKSAYQLPFERQGQIIK